jgi:Nitrogen permease regulator 2
MLPTATPNDGTAGTIALTAGATAAACSNRSQLPVSTPKHPSLCSLLCCFYAEFDIKVGPKIVYQSPEQFMEQDIRSQPKHLEKLLAREFATIVPHATNSENVHCDTADHVVDHDDQDIDKDAEDATCSAQYPSDSSIFDSCSEYIITGSELTGHIINLSTHHLHILTRPTMIADAKYERNSLLFGLGLVLRRNHDPRPYRAVLSKLAWTLRDMEVESQFLSNPDQRPRLQSILRHVLVSLNSPSAECNLRLGPADVLNLKLFRPPQALVSPVRDHDVPILLRRDWQIHSVRACEFGQCLPGHSCSHCVKLCRFISSWFSLV